MTQRIHECLDRAIPPSELSKVERRRHDGLEILIEETVVFLRESPAPDVTPTVMQRIRELEVEASETRATTPKTEISAVTWLWDALEWVWAPRSVQLRPAWALAGLAFITTGFGLFPLQTSELSRSGTDIFSATAPTAAGVNEAAAVGNSAASQEPVLYVRFQLESPGASSVSLAGSFTEWQPGYHLSETRPGHWTALIPLEPGVHDYAFVVDGERWVADPDAMRVNDGFGGVNSRVALLAPESIQRETRRAS